MATTPEKDLNDPGLSQVSPSCRMGCRTPQIASIMHIVSCIRRHLRSIVNQLGLTASLGDITLESFLIQPHFFGPSFRSVSSSN